MTFIQDVATLSFKDKMKLFRETGGSGSANQAPKSKTKISLVSAHDVRSIKADESRKVI